MEYTKEIHDSLINYIQAVENKCDNINERIELSMGKIELLTKMESGKIKILEDILTEQKLHRESILTLWKSQAEGGEMFNAIKTLQTAIEKTAKLQESTIKLLYALLDNYVSYRSSVSGENPKDIKNQIILSSQNKENPLPDLFVVE